MATVSDITVAGLTATPTLRGNKLAWTYSDPRSGALPNIALDMVEVWASTTNDRTTAAKVGEGITDFLHAGLSEEQTWYYWIKPRDYLGAFGAWHPSGSTSGVACKSFGMSGLAFGLSNGKIVATVGSNALTIAVKNAAGNDASASDPVYIAFRNATLATGDYTIRALTSALSLVISSGSTLGAVNATPFRVWIVLFDDAGTLRLGAINCSTATAIYPLAEFGVLSSTAEGGAGAADSAGIIYTGTAVTAKPFRILGLLDWNSGLTTAGTWNATPDVTQMFGPGSKKPGDVVQTARTVETGQPNGGTVIPIDNTIPQNTEGDQYFSTAITPTSPVNYIRNEYLVRCSSDDPGSLGLAVALFRDSAADAIDAIWGFLPGAGYDVNCYGDFTQQALTTSQITYKIRGGLGGHTGSGTVWFSVNGSLGHYSLFGGKLRSYHTVTEIMS